MKNTNLYINKKVKFNTDSYDNEGFVPDFINFYGFERTELLNDNFKVHQNS